MNGTRAEARALAGAIAAAGLDHVDVALCPPFVLLDVVAGIVDGSAVMLGAQNLARESAGAYTGEIAAEMLLEAGCRLVLVGHSERRQYYGETDWLVADKTARALEAGITPVICLGETLEEREAGATEPVVARQLDAVVEKCGGPALGDCVLAYEPVWAIGTGHTATPAQAGAVHAYVRGVFAGLTTDADAERTRILYGGSVKPDNVRELMAVHDIDGALVGGASLAAETFLPIVDFGT